MWSINLVSNIGRFKRDHYCYFINFHTLLERLMSIRMGSWYEILLCNGSKKKACEWEYRRRRESSKIRYSTDRNDGELIKYSFDNILALPHFATTHTWTSGLFDLITFLSWGLRTITDFPLCSISNLGSSPFGRFSKQNLTKEPLSLEAGFVCKTCQYLMHFARLMATKLGGIPTCTVAASIQWLIFSIPLSLSYCRGSSSRRSPMMFSKSTSLSSPRYRA